MHTEGTDLNLSPAKRPGGMTMTNEWVLAGAFDDIDEVSWVLNDAVYG